MKKENIKWILLITVSVLILAFLYVTFKDKIVEKINYVSELNRILSDDVEIERKWIIDKDDTSVSESWGTWYIRDQLGAELEGLKLRRVAEKNIFGSGNYEYRAIPIVVDNVGGISGIITENNGHGYIPEELGGDI